MSRLGSASRGGSLAGRVHFLPALVVPGLSRGGVVIKCGDAAVPSRILAQHEVDRLLLAPGARRCRVAGRRSLPEVTDLAVELQAMAERDGTLPLLA